MLFVLLKKSQKRALLAVLVFGLLAAFFTGCDNGSTDDDVNIRGTLPSGLVGKWDSGYDSFEIKSDMVTLEYDDGGYGYGYTGTIEFVSNYDSRSGVIIIEYSSGAPDTNKPFHAIYYLDYKPGTSVELHITSDANDPNYSADTATLNQAIAKFTRKKMFDHISSDFVGISVYIKQ